MEHSAINIVLGSEKVKKLLDKSSQDFLYKVINGHAPDSDAEFERICRLLFLLTSHVFGEFNFSEENKKLEKDLDSSYKLLKIIDIDDSTASNIFSTIIGAGDVDSKHLYYFYIAAIGLISKNNIKARLDLRKFEYSPAFIESFDWKNRVLHQCIASFILLVRKSRGLEDVAQALAGIEVLKKSQSEFEEKYLKDFELSKKVETAYGLLGLYHLAKVLVETASYLEQGYTYNKNVIREIQRHSDLAKQALADDPALKGLVQIFEVCLLEVQKNSIWFSTQNLASKLKKLCQKLAEQEMVDLLPSQQMALNQGLLDPVSSVAVVQMPTSAGKTLLAEFSILQTLAINSDAKIIYVVPTRALVNQIFNDLRKDFEGIEISVEKTSKVNEIDPSEDLFLREKIDVLVTTAEKLDLLIRKKHPSVEEISLVIVDEVHNIRDGQRGARLELLLAILKREKPNIKYLLLSPFLPNAIKLRDWLASGKPAIQPIKVDWKPADKFICGLYSRRMKKKDVFFVRALPSVYSLSSVKTEFDIPVTTDHELNATKPKEKLMEFTARHFSEKDKTILYLCRGKKTADEKADLIAKSLDVGQPSELQAIVSKYIEDEIGEETVLSRVLKKGVAVHHAGLTDDTRQLVEKLISKKEICHVFATSTVAQGINFPISTIYLDSLRKGDKDISVSEFLNVAGRAGRTLVDSLGKIIFPFNSEENILKAHGYLAESANQITSALTNLIFQAEDIINTFSASGEENMQRRAQLFGKNEALGSLVQYLIHLLTVSEESQYADAIEDLFKDSFGYFLLGENDRKRFIELCRVLYNDLSHRKKGELKLADKTGFSVPSVLKIMHENSRNPNVSAPESWVPDTLFSKGNDFLARKIDIISKLREVDLGIGTEAIFSPELVAKILIGWVNGEKINQLADGHPYFDDAKDKDKINDFVNYLTNATFKSSWGLSALEGIAKSDGEELAENSDIPSMVYYGVKSKSAIAMRMIGAPRAISHNLGAMIYGEKKPQSFNELRKKILGLTSNDWESVKPRSSSLNGAEWKRITELLIA